MGLPVFESSTKSGAGLGAAARADAENATSAAAASEVKIRRFMGPSEENGQADVGFEVVGELVLAEQVGVEDPVLHAHVDRHPVGRKNAIPGAEAHREILVAGEIHAADAAQKIEATRHGEVATEKHLTRQEVVAEGE